MNDSALTEAPEMSGEDLLREIRANEAAANRRYYGSLAAFCAIPVVITAALQTYIWLQ